MVPLQTHLYHQLGPQLCLVILLKVQVISFRNTLNRLLYQVLYPLSLLG